MTFLTPLGGLVALAAAIPLAALLAGRGRVAAVRRALGLAPPPRTSILRHGAAVASIALLGLAATQPALSSVAMARTRTNVEVMFVLDTSRSMAAAASAGAPTRLARAAAAAAALRAEIPTVPCGIASMTDRVLPDLLPVTDVAEFDRVLTQAVAIESPPPIDTVGVNATDLTSLDNLGSGNFFEPGVPRRVVVLLTDGESLPFHTGEIATQLPAAFGYRFLAIRFWAADEGIYEAGGRRARGYHPNPAGRILLARLASSLGGRFFEEADLGAAAGYLRSVVGTGRTVMAQRAASVRTLAPLVAGLAVLLMALALAPAPGQLGARGAMRRLRRVGGGILAAAPQRRR